VVNSPTYFEFKIDLASGSLLVRKVSLDDRSSSHDLFCIVAFSGPGPPFATSLGPCARFHSPDLSVLDRPIVFPEGL